MKVCSNTQFGVDLDHSHMLTRQDRCARASGRDHHYKVMETTIIGVFIQSKDALKTKPIVSMGGKPERDFLSRYLVSACCTHQRIHPHCYKKRAKKQVKVGLQGDTARPMAPLGGQGGSAAPQASVGQEASRKPYSPCASLTDTQKGRQLPKQAGRHPRSFPRGTHPGSPREGLVLHGAGLANSSTWAMERGQWEISVFIQ